MIDLFFLFRDHPGLTGMVLLHYQPMEPRSGEFPVILCSSRAHLEIMVISRLLASNPQLTGGMLIYYFRDNDASGAP